MDNRVELCCHTKMSELQGINEAEEYIEEAINRGNKAIAITDIDSTQAFFKINEYWIRQKTLAGTKVPCESLITPKNNIPPNNSTNTKN